MKKINIFLIALILLINIAFPAYAVTGAIELGKSEVNPTIESIITIDKSKASDLNKIESVSIVNNATKNVVGADIQINTLSDKYEIIIDPMNDLPLGTQFTLKIFTTTHAYTYALYTEKYIDFDDYEVRLSQIDGAVSDSGTIVVKDAYYKYIKVPANPSKGFHFPYFLTVPIGVEGMFGIYEPTGEFSKSPFAKYLLVVPNNTGYHETKNYAEKYMESQSFIDTDIIGNKLALTMEMPLLAPSFPRWGNTNTYTHMLDEETLFMTKATSDKFGYGNMVGIDKQLRAMIADAKEQFKANSVTLQNKIVMNGFSASADFVHRYSMIYPEDVEAIIHQSTVPVYPLKSYSNTTLNFPLGINDYKAKFGKDFNSTAYKAIKQFWFIGSDDHGNILVATDAFNDKDKLLIVKLWGSDGIVRFNKIKTIYKDYTNMQFHMYKDIGHEYSNVINSDVIKFLQNNLGKKSLAPIKPSVYGH